MDKAQETAEFLTRLFEAEEKTGLGLMDLSENRTGVYRQGKCLFIGSYGEACRYVFNAAGDRGISSTTSRLIKN